MCVLFIAVEQHPDYPLIICANRDEFHQRLTKKMHWWTEQNILAGQDLQAGGTWLGLSRDGYFSALTNFRRPDSFDATKRSRGDLVIQALKNDIKQTQQDLLINAHKYNDFNLVFGPLALGLQVLETAITNRDVDIETLLSVLTNQTTAEPSTLPNTGVSAILETLLSSIFITSPEYGTRSSAIILQSTTGELCVYEYTYDKTGTIHTQDNFNFSPTVK
jgi:uncharacterized protein with NRDE domain